jgi:hypothetical protein
MLDYHPSEFVDVPKFNTDIDQQKQQDDIHVEVIVYSQIPFNK